MPALARRTAACRLRIGSDQLATRGASRNQLEPVD